MFEPVYETTQDAVIKVIGVGGGGGNAVDHMSKQAESINGVEFFDVNTDAQVLRKRNTRQTVQIGQRTTGGLGAGADPKVGRLAAEEDKDAIANMLSGAHMTFVAVGMGGGTGTGAAPVVASIAKEQGSLTVAVVTKPFRFEGPRRMKLAEQGIQELSQYVDSLIIIPNDKLRSLGKSTTAVDAFAAANDVLRNCVLGITNMITSAGGPTGADINVDFADVRTVMSEKGHAMIGTGFAEGGVGEGRAEEAMSSAIASPLLENVDISGAKGMLISVNAGTDFLLEEVYAMMDLVYGFATEDATIVFGCNYYPEMDGKVSVTLVATGIGIADEMPKIPAVPQGTGVGSFSPRNSAMSQEPNRPEFMNNMGGGYPNQYTTHQMSQQPQQVQQAVPRPQQVDTAQVFSPNSIPGFMRNGQ